MADAPPPAPTAEQADAPPPVPAEPPMPEGLDKNEVFNAAKQDAIRNDWSCMSGPPMRNPRLPGLKYGSSIEMRPLTMMLPCPCAGGVWSPPHADDGAELDSDGLWHEAQDTWGRSAVAGLPKPVLSMLTHPPPLVPDVDPSKLLGHSKPPAAQAAGPGGGLQQAAGSLQQAAGNPGQMMPRPEQPIPAIPTSELAVPSAASGGPGQELISGAHDAKKGTAFFLPEAITHTYYPGSEPYSIDYGCIEGIKTSPYWTPGKRWSDQPAWTAIAVPTPCPCALGTYSSFKEPRKNHVPPVPDSIFVTPGLGALSGTGAAPWQGGGSYLMGNVGMVGAVLAIVSASILTTPPSMQSSLDSDRTPVPPASTTLEAATRRPTSGARRCSEELAARHRRASRASFL